MVYIRLIVAVLSLVSLAMMLLAVKTQVRDWCVSIRVLAMAKLTNDSTATIRRIYTIN